MKSVSPDSQQTLPCFEVEQLNRTAVGESIRHLHSTGFATTVDISLVFNKCLDSTDEVQLMGRSIRMLESGSGCRSN
jgi:hypothetical protein